MAIELEELDHAAGYPPYPASDVDRFLVWVDGLRLPTWIFYLLLLAALIILFNGLTWIDGSLPFLTFEGYRSSVAVYPVASLALVHYLNGVARRALAAFRPALGVEDSEYERLGYVLVTLPRRGTRITLGYLCYLRPSTSSTHPIWSPCSADRPR